jgi:hypothetical protein
MTISLSSQNVFQYLLERNLCSKEDEAEVKIEPKTAKNFNLLLSWSDDRKLLVKQEPYFEKGKTAGEFLREWRIQDFVRKFSELNTIRSWLPEILHFESDSSILVFKYLTDYRDLSEFYKDNVYPTAIASSIGIILANVHRLTFENQTHRDFFAANSPNGTLEAMPILGGLDRIDPDIFGRVPSDGLKFMVLYQRYESLGKALEQLKANSKSCCLTHNDLKLNNILLLNDWEKERSPLTPLNKGKIRLIDWERSSWGDPAFDVGTLVASYLGIWLGSLVVGKTIELEESLRLAMTPLELIRPSLKAFINSYLDEFPEILERDPEFLRRVMQFAGLALIHTIQSMVQYQKTFSNVGICMLQVAKTLLCRPENSIRTIFGVEEAELIRSHYAAA